MTWASGFTAAIRNPAQPVPNEANVYFRLGHKAGLDAHHGERRLADRATPVNYTAPEGYRDDPAFD
jgi:hypothetical protein